MDNSENFNIKTKIYILFTVFFCVSIVSANLIIKKFIKIPVWSNQEIEISVGALIYPLTFIFTDLITEFYGSHKSKFTIKCGIISSVYIGILVIIASKLSSTSWSPLNNQQFNDIFGLYTITFMASIISNYIAQTIDIKIYITLKNLTKEKMLWLRSNLSTIISQLVDSFIIYFVMQIFKAIPEEHFYKVFISAIIFKIAFTILFTPAYYGIVKIIKYKIKSNFLEKELKIIP